MANRLTRSGIILLASLALAAVPLAALAEDAPPPREGNIWDGRDHEPVPSVVHRDEQADGVAASPRQQRNADDDVESIYRQLMGRQGAQ
jgi:hypothetical protein